MHIFIIFNVSLLFNYSRFIDSQFCFIQERKKGEKKNELISIPTKLISILQPITQISNKNSSLENLSMIHEFIVLIRAAADMVLMIKLFESNFLAKNA